MIVRLSAVLAATAVLGSACGASETRPGPQSVPSPSPSAAREAAAVVPAQLQFTAQTVDGKEFKGESLVGKPAVLWFWAPRCPTCQKEAPMVGRIAGANPTVTFVGVAGLDEQPAMQEFIDRYSVNGFAELADFDGSVWTKFGVTHQPAYAFVGKDGAIDVVKGSLSEGELSQRVTALATP